MQAPIDTQTTETAETADLAKLGTELTTMGYQAQVRTLAGRLPYLDVRNSRASALSEQVYAQGESYWWSWAERIAPRDQVATAAGILARVLRAVGE
jgi:hypothetical protein